jgi:stearoyl-CoA desaturase (delta-9 desaturase)
VLPTLICGLLWGDYWGGYFVVGVARLVFVHHSTFCVNSLAHWAGEAAYTDGHTARNSIITAMVTLGEGYHNFHHEFPSDYRNGVEWWQYDPTKHFIYAAHCLGLAYDLQEFPALEISKGQLQMQQKALDAALPLAPPGSAQAAALARQQKALDARKESVFWGHNPDSFKALTMAEFERECKVGGKQWTVIDGFVVDVAKWMPDHPGGSGLVEATVGKDSTDYFKGESGVEGGYKHSNAARNLVMTLRVARIADYWAK